jgi:hypothetical protein
MTQIKLPKGAKPSKAAGGDYRCPKLMRAYIAEPNGHRELIATDAYILASLPVGDDVPLGAIPAEALKRIEKGEKHEVTEDGVNFTMRDGTTVVYPSNDDNQLPFKQPPTFSSTGCEVIEIALNPKFLAALAEALGAGSGGVKIEIPVRDGQQSPNAMRVTTLKAQSDPKPHGLLVPIRLTV